MQIQKVFRTEVVFKPTVARETMSAILDHAKSIYSGHCTVSEPTPRWTNSGYRGWDITLEWHHEDTLATVATALQNYLDDLSKEISYHRLVAQCAADIAKTEEDAE